MAKDIRPINHPLFMGSFKLYGANIPQLNSLTQSGGKGFLLSKQGVAWVRQVCYLEKETRSGRKVDSNGIDLADVQHIEEVEEEGYKYPGIL